MKKLVEEVQNEGLEKLLGEKITLLCCNYFYTGKLIGVNDSCILIEDPKIIYETGAWSSAEWKDAQSMNIKELYIQKAAIESFGVMK